MFQSDHLMVECTYNTSTASSFIRGGFAGRDEMCLVFLHYYPAAPLAHCASRLSFQHVLLALGINVWPLTPATRHLGLRIRDPWQYQNLTFSDYLKVAASKDTAVNLKLQEASLHHSHKADCYDYGRRRIYAVSILFWFDLCSGYLWKEATVISIVLPFVCLSFTMGSLSSLSI